MRNNIISKLIQLIHDPANEIMNLVRNITLGPSSRDVIRLDTQQ